MPLISNSTVKLVKVTSLLDRPITGTAEYVIYCVDNGVDPKTYWIWKNSAWEEVYTTITDQYIITRQLTGLTITGGTVTSTDTILSAFGKLQNQLNSVASPMIYQGTWNANTNSPALTSSVGTKGHVYRVTTSGATNIDGTIDWKSGDFIVFNGTTWDKWDSTDAVTSVNGYVGNVVLAKSDVGLGNVPNVDATNPANIVQNTNYRFVTDTEKTYWNGKQDALGYVPEDVVNKATTMTGNTASNVKYLTSKAVYDWGTSTFIPLNAPIVGATKTKITYDSKGLVTAGADATTADIADSLNKRYVTDANLIVINNTSNTNTGDETQTSIKTKLGEASATQDGYLSAFYWSAFNNKQSAISLTNIGNSGAASFISNTLNIPVYTISGLGGVSTSRNINTTAPLQGGGDLSADRTLSITQATISSSGYLSSTDWNIFNDKQNALSGGILNRVTKWTSTTGIGNSQIADDGTSIAIGASLNSTVQLGIATNKITALRASSSTGTGISGVSTNATGGTGVKGESTGGYGLFGSSNSTTVDNVGVYGSATDSVSLNIGGKFVALGTSGSKYSVQLQDGTESEGKFLKSITADGKANWATLTVADTGLTLTTTGSSGAATLTSGTLNVPNYTLAGLGGVPSNRQLTINGVAYDLSLDRSWSVGTVTSVNMSVPTGFTIANNPVTTSGTLAVGFSAGYSLPTTASQTNWTTAYNDSIVSASVTGTTTKTITLTQQDGGTIQATWSDIDTAPVTSVFGRTGAVIAQSGDYTTTLVTEGTNLYFTETRVRTTPLTGLSIVGGSITSTDSVLSAFGKIQNQLNAVASPMIYQGTWNANTNTPALTSSVGTKGYVYRVTTSGATNIDGTTDWKSGDFIVFNGTTWDKWDATDAVTSVNGYTGVVVISKADVGLSNVENTALSTWPGTTNITTLGTIGTGVWQGTAIADAYIASAATWNAKVGGTGTANYLPLWSNSTTLATSAVYQDPATSNIGIGTNTPTVNLHIARSTTENFYINLANSNGPLGETTTTDTTKRARLIASNTNSASVSIGQIGTTNTAGSSFGAPGDSYLSSSPTAQNLNIVKQPGDGSTTDHIEIFAGNLATATPSMVILGSDIAASTASLNVVPAKGNIGIGTDIPISKLHVVGSLKVDSSGTVTVPANSPGWYRLANFPTAGGSRGGLQLTYSVTGGNLTPVTYVIKAYKTSSTTVGTLILEKYGSVTYMQKIRLVADEVTPTLLHIEALMLSNANPIIFQTYVEKTLGYEGGINVNLGALSLSTSTANPIRENSFIEFSGGISAPSFQIQNNILGNRWEFRDGSLNSMPGVLNIIGSSSNIIMSLDDTNTRVGIGTVSYSPTAKLHINNITSSDSFLVEDSTNPDSTPFVIDSLGNVGVNFSTPATLGKLVVQGNGANGLVLNTDSGTATNSTRLFFRQSDGNDVSMFNVNGSLRFSFNGTTNNTSGDSKFIMTAAGSLLINATSPTLSPAAPLTTYATGTASAEEVARFSVYDVNSPGTVLSSFMSIRNGTSTDSEFIPQLRGNQASTSTLAGLDLISLVPDTATTNPSFLIRATNTSGGAIINRPSFEIRNAASVIMGANYNTTYSNNYIGFGHNSPTAKVHVRSGLSQIGLKLDKTSTSTQSFEFENSDSGNEIRGFSEIAAAKPIIISNTTNLNNEAPVSGSLDIVFNILGNRIATIADTGNVGIGVNDPSTKLHINSATSGAFRLVDTTQGASKYLKSDTNGVGTWSALSVADTGLTITTTGTSGPATLVGNTLNIPQYSGGGGGSQTLAQTLALGNTTGTNDVILSSGTFIKSPTSKFKLSYDETNNQAILFGSNVDGFGSTVDKTFTLANGGSSIINQETYSGGSGYRYGKVTVQEYGSASLHCYQSSNNGGAQVSASTGASNDPEVTIAAGSNSGGTQIRLKHTSIVVENPNTSNPGIEYFEDYSANFTDRTLVDKAYVDTALSTVSTSSVSHTVKAGIALTKGQAVFVSSADGTNMIVSKADYSLESTSSKVMGLIAQNLSLNGIGQVITEGLLAGLDTSAAGSAGDPVWLGDDGNLLYGLLNKPSAPNHLVFIGIVTRKNNINGEIFIKPQNGFEVHELHDVSIDSIADNDVLTYETATGLWKNKPQAFNYGLSYTVATQNLLY